MAERAAASGADWVIHCDADEFWIARQPGCRLRDQVMALPADQPVQIVQRWNAAIDDQHHWQDWIDPLTVDCKLQESSLHTMLDKEPQLPENI